jgi:hypothetical protein
MLSYENVIQLRDEALRHTLSLPVPPRMYELSGGGAADRSWRATGFFLTDAEGAKLVLELLYIVNDQVAALRVYLEAQSETGPRFAYESLVERYDRQLVLSAAAEFVSSAREMSPRPRDEDEAMLASFPDELRKAWMMAETPVPPPVSFDALRAARKKPS